MREIKFPNLTFWKKTAPLRLGFLATNDCAPLVVAQELGLFEKYDLEVELRREINWSHLRDKLVDDELDAAHAPGTLPFLMNMGGNSKVCRCVSAMVLSLQGNAIVLSQKLWNQGIRDAATLKQRIIRDWGKRTYTFGVMFPYSAQYFLLRRWLRSTGTLCDAQVRVIAVPPTQMYPLLKLGYLDGYCAGELWTTMAVQADAGAYVATSGQLAPMHPGPDASGESSHGSRRLCRKTRRGTRTADRRAARSLCAVRQTGISPATRRLAGPATSCQRTHGSL